MSTCIQMFVFVDIYHEPVDIHKYMHIYFRFDAITTFTGVCKPRGVSWRLGPYNSFPLIKPTLNSFTEDGGLSWLRARIAPVKLLESGVHSTFDR